MDRHDEVYVVYREPEDSPLNRTEIMAVYTTEEEAQKHCALASQNRAPCEMVKKRLDPHGDPDE